MHTYQYDVDHERKKITFYSNVGRLNDDVHTYLDNRCMAAQHDGGFGYGNGIESYLFSGGKIEVLFGKDDIFEESMRYIDECIKAYVERNRLHKVAPSVKRV